MPGNKYPPGDTPPPPITKGKRPLIEVLNERLGYVYSMLGLPADPSLVFVPGTSTSPGRWRAAATGGTAAPATPPFTVVPANAKDKQGNTHAGRVRVYKGFLMGLRPAEMNLIDGTLPDGTDDRCYLTLPEGTGDVYGKVLIDKTRGAGTESHVYATSSTEALDGTYLYRLIAQVTTTNGVPAIEQIWTGNWSPVPLSSGDGSTLYPAGS